MKPHKTGITCRNDKCSFVIALAAFFVATAVHAADCYWTGETSSAWETSGNWTTEARKPTNDGGYFRSDKFHNNFKSGSRAYLVTFSAAETNNWCIAGGEMGKILGKLGKRSLSGENENPVEDGFNGVGMGLE